MFLAWRPVRWQQPTNQAVKLADNSMVPGGINLAQFESMTCSDKQGASPDTTYDNLGPTNTGSTASDLLRTGQMTGVLIMDNYNLFTYSQNAPQITLHA